MTSLSISRRDARRSALRGLVDYAGLFPPASLDMAAAVAGYRSARTGPEAWIVDRFICPAQRLEELVTVLAPTMTAGEEPWRLSVIASPGWIDGLTVDAGAVLTFAETVAAAASVDLVEIRVPAEVAADPDRLAADASRMLTAYQAMPFFELPWQADPSVAMAALAGLREVSGRSLGVKLRCGGPSAELFPTPGEAARFICAAARHTLPMKATAGLHHPYGHVDPETGFAHHGFVNILAATALAHRGEPEETIAEVIDDRHGDHFVLDRAGLSWGKRRVGAADLDAMRTDLFLAYGSCSFDEPVEDLTALGVLPMEVTS